jgi:hypothetical protein
LTSMTRSLGAPISDMPLLMTAMIRPPVMAPTTLPTPPCTAAPRRAVPERALVGVRVVGTELDAIAATVIGGTLLSGGVGLIVGSLLGVLVLGLIQTFISFEGTLSSWWTRIVIGALLVFVVLQRFLVRRST